jgi:hypothetical protein
MGTNSSLIMGRRRVVLVLLGLVLVAGVAAALVWPREREPVYKGRKLSEWVVRSYPAASGYHFSQGGREHLEPEFLGESDIAKRAICHIGTNGLPWLVKWIGHKKSPMKANLFACFYEVAQAAPDCLCSGVSRRRKFEFSGQRRRVCHRASWAPGTACRSRIATIDK